MTREEAIKILRREIECLSHTKCEDCILEAACDPIKTTPYDSEYIEVYEMAIKALEKNESAEEWYKLLCEKWDSAENKGEDRPQGHWIEKGYVGDGNYLFECSECHSTDTQSKAVKVNYCWHCGADMRGGE